MKHKRTIALVLALALLLSCAGFTPAWATSSKQAESTETAQTTQDTPPEKLLAPQFVDSEQFAQSDHVERLYHEERMDTYVYRNRDGTKSVYYMGQNVKYEDKNGNVRDKDTTLVRGDRGYRMQDNDVELHLPDSPADGITLEHSSRSVRLLPQGGRSSANLEDNSIIYPGYFGAETALRYTPLLSGVKEDIILSKYTGQNSFSFVLETGGLYLYEKGSQYYLAENENAEAAFYLGQVVVYDAMGRPDEGSMTVEILIPGQKYRLTLSADMDYLTDPETVYPVTIDPTLTVSYSVQGVNAIVDAPIYEGKPNSNYSNYVYDRVGYYNDEYKTARTVMRLDALLSSNEWQSIDALDITSLTLYIKESSGKSAKQVNIHALTENSTWTESNVTWNNVGTYSTTIYANADLGNDAWTAFNLTTLARGWKTGAQNPQSGFLLKLADESVYRTIYSCEYSTVDYRPYVVLEYAQDLTLSCATVDIGEGSSFTLTATTQLGTPDDLTWISSNTNVATVSENGVVTGVKAGKAIITATCTNADGDTLTAKCTVYVTLADGVYYFQNFYSRKYLGVQDAGITGLVNVQQQNKITSGGPEWLCQLWKVKYLGVGLYTIRPMHKLDKALDATNNNADIYTIGTTDSLANHPYAQWYIEWSSQGYVLRNYEQDDCALRSQNGSTIAGANVVVETYSSALTSFKWVAQKLNDPPCGAIWYDTSTQEAVTDPSRYVEIGETKTLSSLELSAAAYSSETTSQSFYWYSMDPGVVTVNSSTGAVTGVATGTAVIKGRVYHEGQYHYVTYGVCVGYPDLFNDFIDADCITYHHCQNTDDGFFICTQSLANIMLHYGITEIPCKSDYSDYTDISCFYDDWYVMAVQANGSYIYSMYKMREQENDHNSGADYDNPGVTVSFVELNADILVIGLCTPTNDNLYNLNNAFNTVTSSTTAVFNESLANYFGNTQSKGAYLVAEAYVSFIASTATNGMIGSPELRIQTYETLAYYRDLQQSTTDNDTLIDACAAITELNRIPTALDNINDRAGYTVYDSTNHIIYIANPTNLTYYEKIAILATHCGNVSFNSFAAEVEYHADAVYSILMILPQWKKSVIRAEMVIVNNTQDDPFDNYYNLNSNIVQAQVAAHGEY